MSTILDNKTDNKWLAYTTSLAPGILICLLVGMSAKFVSEHYGGPTILYALLMGMALNYLSLEGRCVAGIVFSAKTVLRIGIALLGARITIEQLMGLGITPIAIVVVSVPATIIFGYIMGKWLRICPSQSILTGSSVAICGASAALAVSAVLPQDEEAEKNLVFTVIAVTALSTFAMIAYPLVVTSLDLNDAQAGIFLGSTIHDVAQVVGAGYMMSDSIGDTATFTKLLRVAMLVPAVVIVSIISVRMFSLEKNGSTKKTGGFPLPGFLVAFIIIVLVNSFGGFTPAIASGIVEASRWCLIIAMVGLGMKASFGELVKMGWKPMALVVSETIFLAALVAIWLKMAA